MGTSDRVGAVVSGLTPFQAEVARAFFGMESASGFLLAGGGALLASGLTSRPTMDLDFFGTIGKVSVQTAGEELEQVALQRNWSCERLQAGDTFVRLLLRGSEDLVVDLAIDAPAVMPSVSTEVGPTFHPTELAARKLVALFSRAEARDFADVFVLAQLIDPERVISCASEVDLGFEVSTLAEMMRTVVRFAPEELSDDQNTSGEIQKYFLRWAAELSAR